MSPPENPRSAPVVLNLRHNGLQDIDGSIRAQVIQGLTVDANKGDSIIDDAGRVLSWSKSLPTAILYESEGIQLYEDITRSDGYYLYREEMATITKYMDDIAVLIMQPDPELVDDTAQYKKASCEAQSCESPWTRQRVDSVPGRFLPPAVSLNILDLGAGRPDEAMVLLDAIHKNVASEQWKSSTVNISYHAIDLQYKSLCTRLEEAAASRPFLSTSPEHKDGIAISGICGTYQTALHALQGHLQSQAHRKCLLWLGSSVTNFAPSSAVALLREFCCISNLGREDSFLVGIDRCQDVNLLSAAYGSQSSHWKKYVLNGMSNAGKTLGGDAAIALQNPDYWEYVAKWDSANSRHVRYVKARSAVSFQISEPDHTDHQRTISIHEGEHIFLRQSYKYKSSEILQLFGQASLRVVKERGNERGDGSVYLLRTAQP